ncbi:MAG: dienelactone hydrolase family protein [Myxococcota bacterium]
MIEIEDAAGGRVAAYRAPVPPDARGRVVLLHDWWGLTDSVRRAADRLADAGYDTIAPDLYDGYCPQTPLEAMRHLTDLDLDAVVEGPARAAATHMGALVAMVGFSLGGRVAMIAAGRGLSCRGFISFYGIPGPDEVGIESIRQPVQVHLCRGDDFFRSGRQPAVAAELEGAAVDHQVYWYDAPHGFVDEARGAYDERAAALAWERAMAFLHERVAAEAVVGDRISLP